jgi:predicted Na+-dependent transporter
VLFLIASNFVILSGFFILSSFFVSNQEFRQGIIVLAATPPAIAVITTAFLLKADTKKALLAEAGCYILSIILTPLIIWFFFRSQVDIWALVKILLLLIILPFLLAKGLDWLKKRLGIKHDFKEIANIAFALTFYMGIGLAVDRIMASLNSIALLLVIIVLSCFGLGIIVILLAKKSGSKKEELPLYPLFMMKNGNLALGICITLFPVGSYVPVALQGIVHAFYIFSLFWFFKRFNNI